MRPIGSSSGEPRQYRHVAVADGVEMEPVRGRGRARLCARPALQEVHEPLRWPAPAGDLEHRPDEDPDHASDVYKRQGCG